jgi:hypothetical protein
MGENPAMSWKAKATLDRVRRSTEELAAMGWMNRETIKANHGCDPPFVLEDDDVYLPLVGCGNGGLSENAVLPILFETLRDDRFVLVKYRPF